jgi:hypothetical protein
MTTEIQQTANCQGSNFLTEWVHPKSLSKVGRDAMERKLLKLNIIEKNKSFAEHSCQIG